MLRFLWIGIAAISLAAGSVAQASTPAVAGNVTGLEIAQQTDEHGAIFVGLFGGTHNGNLAVGTWAAAVNHEPELPDEIGESIEITGGQWQLHLVVLQGFRLKKVSLAGSLEGTLTLVDEDMFSIAAGMLVDSGGSGLILLTAILDHTVFPPGISGALSQP
jgi:hypothetical protein